MTPHPQCHTRELSEAAHQQANNKPRTTNRGQFQLINRIRHQLHGQRLEATRFHLFLPGRAFVLFWWLVVVLHTAAAAFLGAMVVLYHWLLHDNMEYMLANLTFHISHGTLDAMTWSFAFIAVMHGIKLAVILWRSFHARELRFNKICTICNEPIQHVEHPADAHDGEGAGSCETATCSSPSPSDPCVVDVPKGKFALRVWHHWWCLSRRIFGVLHEKWVKWIESVFYIRGQYFEQYVVFRKYGEVVAQLYQARQMSVLISTRWLNHVFVAMIFLNCMATPMIHAVFKQHARDLPLRRFVGVMSSCMLNFCNSIVIPLVIFMPYVRAYDPTIQYFAEQYTMNDVWYATAVRENQKVFITSTIDFLATWMPQWSLFSCLHTCENLLRRQRADASASHVNPITAVAVVPKKPDHPVANCSKVFSGGPKVHELPTLVSAQTSFKSTYDLHDTCDAMSNPQGESQVRKRWAASVPFNLLACIGVIVLGIHLLAHRVKALPGCKLQSSPWFVTQSSCVIMNINCYRQGIDGTEQEILSILTKLHNSTVFQLIFSHCHRLQIPSIIQGFGNLGGLDLYNVSLDQWSMEASLRQESHPFTNYVYIFRSNLSGIPPGLMDATFPKALEEMYFYDVNLTELPTDLHNSWATLTYLSFDGCPFEEFPSTLARMPLESLTFTSNLIPSLNYDLFTNKALYSLRLSGNAQLRRLPNQTAGNMEALARLTLEYTDVSDVPGFIRQWYLDRVQQGIPVDHSLFGSPFCNQTRDANVGSPDDERYRGLVCSQDVGSEPEAVFISDIDLQRPL